MGRREAALGGRHGADLGGQQTADGPGHLDLGRSGPCNASLKR
jgi:hypothetical protein